MTRALLALLIAFSWPVEAAQKRDPAVRRAFMLEHPCPATGKTKGRCDGWQVDHRQPLCYFGKDEIANLQWLSVKDHREKTKLDIKTCDWDGRRG